MWCNTLDTRVEEVDEIEEDVYTKYKKHMIIWETVGLAAIFGIGALWHYIYEWLPWKPYAWLFPINESVWEHVKMLIWPSVILFIVQYFVIGKKFNKFIIAKTEGLFAGVLALFSFWYTLQGAFGASGLWFGISNFLFAVCVQQVTSYIIITIRSELDEKLKMILNIVSLVAVGLLLVAVIVITYVQPAFPIFYDTANAVYGFVPTYG